MILGMFMVAVLASVIPDAFHGETASFALAYAGVRAVVVLLNARAWWHLPAARPLLNVYIPAFSASIVLFLVSTAVAPPYRYWLWALALAIDLGTPLASQERIRQVPIHAPTSRSASACSRSSSSARASWPWSSGRRP